MKQFLCSRDAGVRRRSWRQLSRIPHLVAILATTVALAVRAEAPPATTRAPVASVEGRPVATELPPEVERLIDAARRLQKQPGLILDREAIYETLGVQPKAPRTFRTTEGSRSMAQELVFDPRQAVPNWQASLTFSEDPRKAIWSVKVEMSYEGFNCYPSRLVEAYWGEAFVYRPLGVHAFLDELLRKQRAEPPTGPHDGVPYHPEFVASYANSADVIFGIGRGGCLSTISTSRLFNIKEYSDENIYHE